MDDYMSVLFMLTISFPEAMLLAYFAMQFMNVKPRLLDIVLIGLIQSVVAYTVRNLPLPVGLHTIIQILSLITLVSLISRMRFITAAIGLIISVAFYILQEILSQQILLTITGLTTEQVIAHPYMRILFFIPSIFVMLGTIKLCKKYNINFERLTGKKTEKDYLLSEEQSSAIHKEYLPVVIFIFLPVLILYILNFTYLSVRLENIGFNYSTLFKIFVDILIVFLAFVSVWALRRITSSIEKDYEVKKAEEIIEQLKELMLSIRKQRHDFNNHLQTVYGLIEIGSYAKARDYIKNTYDYVAGTGELIKTDNPTISALLYSKMVLAETRSIRFQVSIECSLEDFPLNSNEVTSLLGNLIDNAFDAVEKNDPANKNVELTISLERGVYIINLTNSGEIDKETVEKIFARDFTTKKGHSGLGLTIVKSILEKHKGSVNVDMYNGNTVFEVSIPLKR